MQLDLAVRTPLHPGGVGKLGELLAVGSAARSRIFTAVWGLSTPKTSSWVMRISRDDSAIVRLGRRPQKG
jgi:hypothetical protein